MKRFVLSIAALSAVLITSGAAAESAPNDSRAPQEQKEVKVLTLHGEKAVNDFEHDVQVMQLERQNALQLRDALNKETNPKKKKDLQAKFDAAMKKLEQDNLAMAKTYGFSLTRNYRMQIVDADVYMAISDEEAARLDKLAAEKKAEEKKAGKK